MRKKCKPILTISEGEKIIPKAWRKEQGTIEREMPDLRSERARACHDLACAEVIGYNKTNLERIEQNESRKTRQPEHEQTSAKNKRREEII